jgi:hypothetical protein
VLAGNVRSTLRLDESSEEVRDRLEAEIRPASQVLVIAASDDDADKARQIAQEAAVVFTRLVEARFGTRSPPLQGAVLDSAHPLSPPNRHFLRNTLIGVIVGLLLGSAAAFLWRGGTAGIAPGAPDSPPDLGERERTLERRIREITRRERELARHAARLAPREPQAPPPTPEPARPEPTVAPAAAPVAPPGPPEPATAAAVDRGGGAWNLAELEGRVEAHSGLSPEQGFELRSYLFYLRQFADSDGSLPHSFDALIDEVFGDVMQEGESGPRR